MAGRSCPVWIAEDDRGRWLVVSRLQPGLDEASRVSVRAGQQPASLEATRYRVPSSINPVNRELVNSHFARRFWSDAKSLAFRYVLTKWVCLVEQSCPGLEFVQWFQALYRGRYCFVCHRMNNVIFFSRDGVGFCGEMGLLGIFVRGKVRSNFCFWVFVYFRLAQVSTSAFE